ncbi:MAG: PilZ domain-containing protein [Desulfatitalea sp.]|nr:PilZ domain-containing protein [Desulfatitalea sp.]NNK02400.1 PilZ domain-containing protein [Desulfatitalea sp.]
MKNQLVFGERRLHQRKECTFAVKIDDTVKVYQGHLRNLSLSGALIKPPTQFKARIGKELYLTIPFRNRGGDITIKGQIIYHRHNGMVVVFLR